MQLLKALRQILSRGDTVPPEPWPTASPHQKSTARTAVTPDTSLKIGTVWRCVNYIDQTLAGLPWHIRRVDKDKKTSEILYDHPVSRVLNVVPNPEMTPYSWREAMCQSVQVRGNGYSEIVFDNAGRVKELWYLSPDRVTLKRSYQTDTLYYEVSNRTGPNTYLPPERVFHVRGLGYDGLVGYSVIAYAMQTLGASLAMDQHNGAFYGNSASPGGVLKYPRRLSVEAKKRLRNAWNDAFRGSKKSFSVAVLEEGMDFSPITIPHKDAQFVESRDWTVIDICRWFGVPPQKVFDFSSTIYNTAEVANRDVVTDTILPWAQRFEQEANRKLLGNQYGGLISRMDTRELLRGDAKARSDFYNDLSKVGAISINEIRENEGMNPIPQGDVHLVAANNFLPLGTVLEGGSPAAQRQSGLQGEPPEQETEEESSPSEEDEINARLVNALHADMLAGVIAKYADNPDVLGLQDLIPDDYRISET